jgi:hypothetical protein
MTPFLVFFKTFVLTFHSFYDIMNEEVIINEKIEIFGLDFTFSKCDRRF